MSYANRLAWAGVAAALFLGAGGCATRGYVRSQVADLKTDMGRVDTDLRSGIDNATSAADQADKKAVDAAQQSESARLMALGNVGYREVERYRVYFPFDKAIPKTESDGVLQQATSQITARPNCLVEIYGYTDHKGPDAYNLELARRRAEAIQRMLVAQAPEQLSRFHAIGFGKSAPPSEANTLGDGADRRQVVIVLVERTAPGASAPAPITENQGGPR